MSVSKDQEWIDALLGAAGGAVLFAATLGMVWVAAFLIEAAAPMLGLVWAPMGEQLTAKRFQIASVMGAAAGGVIGFVVVRGVRRRELAIGAGRAAGAFVVGVVIAGGIGLAERGFTGSAWRSGSWVFVAQAIGPAAGASLGAWRALRAPRRARRCRACGYDVSGVARRPECGERV